VKTARARGPDVHAWTLTDSLEALEDRDVLRVITQLWGGAVLRAAVVRRQRTSD
jgi:hypothetical protein